MDTGLEVKVKKVLSHG